MKAALLFALWLFFLFLLFLVEGGTASIPESVANTFPQVRVVGEFDPTSGGLVELQKRPPGRINLLDDLVDDIELAKFWCLLVSS